MSLSRERWIERLGRRLVATLAIAVVAIMTDSMICDVHCAAEGIAGGSPEHHRAVDGHDDADEQSSHASASGAAAHGKMSPTCHPVLAGIVSVARLPLPVAMPIGQAAERPLQYESLAHAPPERPPRS